MNKPIDLIYDSCHDSKDTWHPLASGYISETTVLFQQEHVIAVIQAKGRVEFFDTEGRPIAVGAVPEVNGGREVYTDIAFHADGPLLSLRFPIYEWIDNYPHCDGEHDRWDTRIVGSHTLTLNTDTGLIV